MNMSSFGNVLVTGREGTLAAVGNRNCPCVGSLIAGFLCKSLYPFSVLVSAFLRGARLVLPVAWQGVVGLCRTLQVFVSVAGAAGWHHFPHPRSAATDMALFPFCSLVSSGGLGLSLACLRWFPWNRSVDWGWGDPGVSCRSDSELSGLGEGACHV